MSALLLFALALPVDCLPDAVQAWDVSEPENRFGAPNMPGVVLGVPGESAATTGATTVASLGVGGAMTYAIVDIVIEDRPGPDLIVFENAFYQGVAPSGPEDDYLVFHEPGFVEVSADGETWERFPYDAQALAEAGEVGSIDRALHERLAGLAGVSPTYSGNWTIPSTEGAGGDAFDLATVGLAEARHVRIIDAGLDNGLAANAQGFDLDALVVLHGRPLGSAAPDADGDGLSDAMEWEVYGTRDDLPDTDFDGTDDGREVAGCRDPLSDSIEPWLVREPRLWLKGSACTEVRWNYLGPGLSVDVVRGDECLAEDWPGLRWSCDDTLPPPGEAWRYLVTLADDPSGGCP